ncbi:MAG: PASTA domain-containing protein, partial [Sedimentisphaerales bacterium]
MKKFSTVMLLSLVFAATVFMPSAMAETITIGSGTSSWAYPLSTYYEDARTQTIYLASEIGGAKSLKSLALDITTIPGMVMNNFTIRMKHTSLSVYSTKSWESTGWTIVYQSNQAISATGWKTFTFSTPFSYDGTNNLMVDISFNNTSSNSYGYCRYSQPGGTRSIYYRTDSSYGDPLMWSGSISPTPSSNIYVPNIQLGYGDMVTVPDVVGMTQSDAQTAIIAEGLNVGTVSTVFSDTVVAGNVISQDPTAGNSVVFGGSVNIVVSLGAAYSGGSGEPNDPYLIRTPANLNNLGAISTHWDKCFKLVADINMAAYTGTQYKIIGNGTTQFTGTFDGNGHIIRNLTYTTTASAPCVGLFGYTENATIKDLGIEDINIDADGTYVGGLVGWQEGGTITNCYSTGAVTTTSSTYYYAGGLIGSQTGGTATNCYSIGSVTASAPTSTSSCFAGGLIGYQSDGTVTDCYSTGSVISSGGRYSYAGGLVGMQYESTTTNCNSTGAVNCSASNSASSYGSKASAGGLIGEQQYGTVTNCYSTGAVMR